MSVYTIVFSPTGGTQRVMNILGEAMGAKEAVDISLCRSYADVRFTAEDVCLIGVPSYGGRVPAVAAQRIGQLQGNGAKAVLVSVYGNRAIDDTLAELQDVAEAAGFRVIGGVAAVAEHSMMPQFGTGRPDNADAQELRGFAKQLLDSVNRADAVAMPGDRPYRKFGGLPITPKANKNCTGCGLCAEKCPVGAISKENPRVTDKDACITCMRCVAICPKGARGVNKTMMKASAVAMKKACEGRKPNELYI